MIRVLAAACAAGLLFGAGQALATDEPAAATPVAPPPSAAPPPASRLDPNQVICKRQEVPGTRLGGSKLCHTRQEWADIAAAARNSVAGAQRSALTGLVPGH